MAIRDKILFFLLAWGAISSHNFYAQTRSVVDTVCYNGLIVNDDPIQILGKFIENNCEGDEIFGADNMCYFKNDSILATYLIKGDEKILVSAKVFCQVCLTFNHSSRVYVGMPIVDFLNKNINDSVTIITDDGIPYTESKDDFKVSAVYATFYTNPTFINVDGISALVFGVKDSKVVEINLIFYQE